MTVFYCNFVKDIIDIMKKSDLWRIKKRYRYVDAPNFGQFMARDRLQLLQMEVCFSYQPPEPGHLTSEGHRWCLCKDFRNAVSYHREEHDELSKLISMDESISI